MMADATGAAAVDQAGVPGGADRTPGIGPRINGSGSGQGGCAHFDRRPVLDGDIQDMRHRLIVELAVTAVVSLSSGLSRIRQGRGPDRLSAAV